MKIKRRSASDVVYGPTLMPVLYVDKHREHNACERREASSIKEERSVDICD